MDWTGRFTIARVKGGEAHWETTSEAAARTPIAPVSVTPRQLAILRFIAQHRRDRGRMPTYAEIAAGVGLCGRGPVGYQMRILEDKGLVQRAAGRAGAIVLNVSF